MHKPTTEYYDIPIGGNWANVKELLTGQTWRVPNMLLLALGIGVEVLLIMLFNSPL